MTDQDGSAGLALAFVALNEYVSRGADRGSAMQRLVELAVDSIPGCEWAAITLWPKNRGPRSLTAASDVARQADQLQYDLGEGPCLSAAATGQPVVIADLSEGDRWPTFAAAARSQTPVRGVLALYLGDEPHPSALNLYSSQAGAFDRNAVNVAALFAAHARVLVIHAGSAEHATNLGEALTTSRQIGSAVGILMEVHGVSADDGFELLKVASQNLNQKLSLIADEVTRTGSLPGEPARQR